VVTDNYECPAPEPSCNERHITAVSTDFARPQLQTTGSAAPDGLCVHRLTAQPVSARIACATTEVHTRRTSSDCRGAWVFASTCLSWNLAVPTDTP
jgi:hypothetical protein